ncbi:hypothetical protein [Lacrimispora brassicae]
MNIKIMEKPFTLMPEQKKSGSALADIPSPDSGALPTFLYSNGFL